MALDIANALMEDAQTLFYRFHKSRRMFFAFAEVQFCISIINVREVLFWIQEEGGGDSQLAA